MAQCEMLECTDSVKALGLCTRHYTRQRRYGSPEVTVRQNRSGCCEVDGCESPIQSRRLCRTHYSRWKSKGDVLADVPVKGPRRKRCTLPGCRGTHVAFGYCEKHYDSYQKYGDPHEVARRKKAALQVCSVHGCDHLTKNKGVKFRAGELQGVCNMHRGRWKVHKSFDLPARPEPVWSKGNINSNGYRVLCRDNVRRLEHRVVMEKVLGRELIAGENVHHINGDRLDNRIENLELWVRSQPSGQRAADLVAWARQIERQYGRLVDSGVISERTK
jgi:hypothetical protein